MARNGEKESKARQNMESKMEQRGKEGREKLMVLGENILGWGEREREKGLSRKPGSEKVRKRQGREMATKGPGGGLETV